ncbi:MAG: hypothetical protein MSS24_02460 [Clostridiales bacterium]|nr:hypothetical protein [Clostridiales bacterium]
MKTMTKLLIASVIIGLAEWLWAGVIDGLCFLWTAPLIMLADDGLLEDWAQKKLEEK